MYLDVFRAFELFFVFYILFYISYIDFKTRMIEDWATVFVAAISLLYAGISGTFLDSLQALGIALVIHLFFFFVVYTIYGFEAFGQGDVLLMGALGAFLGCHHYMEYFFLQVMGTGVMGCFALLYNRKDIEKSFALAPFYVFWLAVYFILGKPDVIGAYCGLLANLF